MERIRVAGILPMEDGFALMHRVGVTKNKDIQEYYTFPGGGLEDGESLEEGTKREIEEEFGVKVEIVEKLYENYFEKLNQKEVYFLCKYISGKFGTGTGPEFTHNLKYIDSGNYIPEIIKEENISNLLLLPPEIKDKFVEDINKGRFKNK